MLLIAMWTSFRGCHRVASTTEEGVVKEHRCNGKLRRVELSKNEVCVIFAIVGPYTGMIAAHNEMRTPIVLAHECMEDSFAWTGITHSGRKHTQDDPISRVVVLQQHFIATHTYIRGNIIPFGVTDQWV